MSFLTKKIDKLYIKTYTTKRWHNIGEFCDGKRHPLFLPYRRYKRGKYRCVYCGAKLGDIRCVYKSPQDILIDDIFASSPLMKLLKNKGAVK